MALNRCVWAATPARIVPPNAFTFLRRGAAQVRQLGLRLIWLRYVRRRAILRTAPLPCPEDAAREVHTQICARDGLNVFWTLKSFAFHTGGEPFRLVVFCDGSITPEFAALVRQHFPGALVQPVAELPAPTRTLLAEDCPTLWKMRADPRYITLPKITDSYSLRRRDVVLMIDPDVLFFAPPTELLADPDGSRAYYGIYNIPPQPSDLPSTYCLDYQAFETRFGLQLPRRFNAGLGSVNYRLFDWSLLEEVATKVPFNPDLGLMTDQTLAGITCAAHGLRELPVDRYALQPVASLSGVTARHYFSKTRDLLYTEGLPALIRQGLLKK